MVDMHKYCDVTVVIPHISERAHELVRAVHSVSKQTMAPYDIIISTDAGSLGSAHTRNRALDKVTTEWVAFLDDDDEFLPNHLETLLTYVEKNNYDVDVVYPGCRVINPALGGIIPLRDEWGRFNKPFDANLLRNMSYIPVTSLVRTHLAQLAQFGPPDHDLSSFYDDWGFYLRLLEHGARFIHVPEVTWIWNHHGKNTSGLACNR